MEISSNTFRGRAAAAGRTRGRGGVRTDEAGVLVIDIMYEKHIPVPSLTVLLFKASSVTLTDYWYF